MTLTSRSEILSQTKRRFKDIPLNGGTYRIRSLTAREWLKHNKDTRNPDGTPMPHHELSLIALCLVDDDGNVMLTDADLPQLEDWDSQVAVPLYWECMNHCGIAKSVGDVEKNSGVMPTSDST